LSRGEVFWNGYLFRKIMAVVIDFGGCMLEILIPLVCALCERASEIQTTADAQDDRHNISYTMSLSQPFQPEYYPQSHNRAYGPTRTGLLK
jgi:hypothetical protein